MKSLTCPSYSESAGIVAYHSRCRRLVYIGEEYEDYWAITKRAGDPWHSYFDNGYGDFDSDRWYGSFDGDRRYSAFDYLVDSNLRPSNTPDEKYLHIYSYNLIGSSSNCDGDSLRFQYADEEVEMTFTENTDCAAFAGVLRDAGISPEN